MTSKTRPWRGTPKTVIANTIDNYVIGARAVRNREILKACWIDGDTVEMCAEEKNMSARHVQKILSDWYPVIDEQLHHFSA